MNAATIYILDTGDWQSHPCNTDVLTGWARVPRGPNGDVERVLVTVVSGWADYNKVDRNFTATAYLTFSGGVIARHSSPRLDPALAIQEVLDMISYKTPTEPGPAPLARSEPNTQPPQATPPEATCATCWYSRARGGGTPPECRKHPPVVGNNGRSAWPTVTQYDWCGAHEPCEGRS